MIQELVAETTALSANAVVRLKECWVEEDGAWRRPLGEHQYACIWADGIYLGAGLEKKKMALLCVLVHPQRSTSPRRCVQKATPPRQRPLLGLQNRGTAQWKLASPERRRQPDVTGTGRVRLQRRSPTTPGGPSLGHGGRLTKGRLEGNFHKS